MEQYWKISFVKLIVLLGCLKFASSVELRFYEGSLAEYTTIDLDDDFDATSLLQEGWYSPDRDTVIYTHGYLQRITDNSGQLVLQAYLDGNKTNVVGMDWSDVVIYPTVGLLSIPRIILEIGSVGQNLAEFIVKLINAGLSLERLHLIGFSIGAHCMGFTGREIQSLLNQSVPRITGIDAGGPFTDGIEFVQRLKATDGKFVDIIHANPRSLGTSESFGTVDIWVNCDTPIQPGCEDAEGTNFSVFTPQDICSHLLCPKIFADAVRRSTDFVATSASDCTAWTNGNVTGNTIYLGDNIDQTATGLYYIKIDTNTSEYQTTAAADENNELQRRQLDLQSLIPL